MQVFISRKKQNVGTNIDFGIMSSIEAILICSDKHIIMINDAIKNNTKSNAHYETNKRLYVHYVDDGQVVNVTCHV